MQPSQSRSSKEEMNMKQEMLAGIVIGIIGLLLCLFPSQVWKLTEAWKTRQSGTQSDKYSLVLRIVGGVFFCLGVLLMLGVL